MAQNIQSSIEAVFNSFDIDKSGYVDLSELSNIAKTLGQSIPQQQLSKIVKKLDLNKDGKISFQQFKYWWQNGIKGPLGKLVYLKAKSMKMGNKFMGKLQDMGIKINQLDKNQQMQKINVQIQFGQLYKQGIRMSGKIYQNNKKYEDTLKQLKNSVQDLDIEKVNMFIILSSSNAISLKESIQNILNKILSSGLVPLKIQDLQNNNIISIKLIPKQDKLVIQFRLQQLLMQIIQNFTDIYDSVNQQLGQNNNYQAQFSLSTFFTIQQLLQSKSLIQMLLKGLQVKFNLLVPSQIMKKVRFANQQLNMDSNFMNFLSVLIKNVNVKLKLRSPKMIQKFFQKLGIKQIVQNCPNLSDLLQQFQNFPEVIQMKLNQQSPAHLLYKLLKCFHLYVDSKIQVYLVRRKTIIKGSVYAENASKIYKTLFNQL